MQGKVKAALDEARMLVTGLQFLLGFGHHIVLYAAFDRLAEHARALHGASIGLILIALGLLLAVGPFHRIAERGEDTARVHAHATRMVEAALAPFALALGFAVFVVFERSYGTAAGAAVGATITVLALALWYGLELARRHLKGEAMKQAGKTARTPLHDRIDHILTEARVVLPGAQGLLGFQFTAYFTEGWDKLPELSQALHTVSLLAIALAVVLLMAPAAYHRIVAQGEDREDVDRFAAYFVVAALAPLALGLAGDLYVVMAWITQSAAFGAAAAAAALLGFLGLWYGLPLIARRSQLATRRIVGR
jgi:hypothetical protein